MTTGATGPEGPPMKTFYIKSRRTSPILFSTVDAPTRDDAIHAMILACPPDEQIEVLQVEETAYSDGPTGTTGTTGTTGATGGTGAARANRAQLNDMTKEELIEEAADRGVEVHQNWTKADIIDAIVKHR